MLVDMGEVQNSTTEVQAGAKYAAQKEDTWQTRNYRRMKLLMLSK
jgi:hypothetical protein